MKLLKHLKIKPLDKRGVSHLLIPLLAVLVVAVGGTFALVAGHANPAHGKIKADAHVADPDTTSRPHGIKIDDKSTKKDNHGCRAEPDTMCKTVLTVRPLPGYGDKAHGNAGKKVITGFVGVHAVTAKGTTINMSKSRCANTDKKKYPKGPISTLIGANGFSPWPSNLVYVPAGTVNPDKSKTPKAYCLSHIYVGNATSGTNIKVASWFFGNSYLKPSNSYSYVTLDQQAPAVTVFPRFSKDKKSITGYLTVRIPDPSDAKKNLPISKAQCYQPNGKGAEVTVNFSHTNRTVGEPPFVRKTLHLSYIVPKVGSKNPAHYCVAKFKLSNVKADVQYTITTALKSTPYLKAAHTVMKFPDLGTPLPPPAPTEPAATPDPANNDTSTPPANTCPENQVLDPADGVTCVDKAVCDAPEVVDPNDVTSCIDPNNP